MVVADTIVQPLAWHRRHLPLIAGWFRSEWMDWYGPLGQGNAEEDLLAFASGAGLPVGVLAISRGEPCGIAALKKTSIPTHDHLCPWAAAGYVVPGLRGKGIGAMLLALNSRHACAHDPTTPHGLSGPNLQGPGGATTLSSITACIRVRANGTPACCRPIL